MVLQNVTSQVAKDLFNSLLLPWIYGGPGFQERKLSFLHKHLSTLKIIFLSIYILL